MPETPNPKLLDREIYRIQIEDSFRPQLELLEQLVNYGSQLVPRCFTTSSTSVADMVAILSFLKQFVSGLDAISILARQGSSLACYSHLRTLLELQIYLKWIFAQDTERRAKAYFVWDIRQQRFWLKSYLQGTDEYVANQVHMKGSPIENLQTPWTQAEIQKAIEVHDRNLKASELQEVEGLFENYIAANPRKKRPNWYEPLGVQSVREMAKSMEMEGEYKVLYSKYSQYMHGLSIDKQITPRFEGGEVVFNPIRSLDSIDDVFIQAFNLAVETYRIVIQQYRPSEEALFNKKYLWEWRHAIQTTSHVETTDDGYKITPTTDQS